MAGVVLQHGSGSPAAHRPPGDPSLTDLFGNPPDGSFLAWLAGKGIWTALIVIGAIVAWWMIHRLTEAWISRTVDKLEQSLFFGQLARLKAVLRWADEVIVGLLVGTPAVIAALDVLGVDIGPVLDWARSVWEQVRPWLLEHGIKLAAIILVGFAARRFLGAALPRWLTAVMLKATQEEGEDPDEARKRAETLSSVFGGIVSVLIYLVVALTALLELSVPVGPLIGSLGLVGVAVGFGSQWLVRDVVAGAFIIGENQYRKGDVVEVAGVSGLVESISLRRTILRDIDGKMHIVPNGEIKVASNFSRKWARVNLDVEVAYKHDTDHVMMVLGEICEQLSGEPYFSEIIIEPPKPLAITKFDASGVTIKVLGMTKPLKNGEVKNELMYRIKKRFDEESIEIPFPHMTVYWGDGAHPVKGDVGSAEAAHALQERLNQRSVAAAARKAAAMDLATSKAVDKAEKLLSSAFEKLADERAAADLAASAPARLAEGAARATGRAAGHAVRTTGRIAGEAREAAGHAAGEARGAAGKVIGEAQKARVKLSEDARKAADKLRGLDHEPPE